MKEKDDKDIAETRQNDSAEKAPLVSVSFNIGPWIAVAAVIVLIAVVLYIRRDDVQKAYDYLFDSRTEVGHVMLSDLVKTDKLTVVSMYKEVIVSQYKLEPGLIYGTNEYQIHSVYPGRLDVGFDLTRCADDWLTMRGDTAYVKLPPVEILNQGDWYLDEAKRQTPIEEGEWSNQDYAMLAARANALLKRTCELDGCYRMAESQGRSIIENLLKTMNARVVVTDIQLRSSYGPWGGNSIYAPVAADRYRFYESATGNTYVRFNSGGALFYKGDIADEDLYALIDLYAHYTENSKSRFWNLYKSNGYVSLSIVNVGIDSGSAQARSFRPSLDSGQAAEIRASLYQLFGNNVRLTLSEVDSKGRSLHRY